MKPLMVELLVVKIPPFSRCSSLSQLCRSHLCSHLICGNPPGKTASLCFFRYKNRFLKIFFCHLFPLLTFLRLPDSCFPLSSKFSGSPLNHSTWSGPPSNCLERHSLHSPAFSATPWSSRVIQNPHGAALAALATNQSCAMSLQPRRWSGTGGG